MDSETIVHFWAEAKINRTVRERSGAMKCAKCGQDRGGTEYTFHYGMFEPKQSESIHICSRCANRFYRMRLYAPLLILVGVGCLAMGIVMGAISGADGPAFGVAVVSSGIALVAGLAIRALNPYNRALTKTGNRLKNQDYHYVQGKRVPKPPDRQQALERYAMILADPGKEYNLWGSQEYARYCKQEQKESPMPKRPQSVAPSEKTPPSGPQPSESIDQKRSQEPVDVIPADTSTPSTSSLIQRLKDADASVRSEAVELLGESRDARAVEPLIAMLHDKDQSLREAVVQALGQIGDPRAVSTLASCLADQESTVRTAAAQALRQCGEQGRKALVARGDALLAQLTDDNWRVASAAAVHLGDLHDMRAARPLVGLLEETNANLRYAAAWSLEKIGPRIEDPGLRKRAGDLLIGLLNDEAKEVRTLSAAALGEMGEMRAVDALIRSLKDSDTRVCTNAAEALGKLGDERAIEPLITCLMRGDWARSYAADALHTITGESFGEDAVRWRAWLDGKITGPTDTDMWKRMSSVCRGDKASRIQAARELIERGGDEALWGHVLLSLHMRAEGRDRSREVVEAAGEAVADPIAWALTVPDLSSRAADQTRTGPFDLVRYHLEQRIVEQPNWPEAWFGLGQLYFCQGRFASALACFEYAQDLGLQNDNLTSILEQLQRPEYARFTQSMPILRIAFGTYGARGKLDCLHE